MLHRGLFFIAGFLMSVCFISAASAGEPTKLYELKGDFKADTVGLKLVKVLVDTLTPESLEVIFDAEPDADGSISNLYVEAKGISAGTPYRLDYVALGGKLLKLAPPSQWNVSEIRTLQPQKWEGFFNAELVLKEDDLRKAIPSFISQNKDAAEKWSDLFVDFRPGLIVLKGKYDVNSGMNAAFEIKTGLELRAGKQLWLVNTNVQINKDEQTDAIRKEIKKRNPPVDLAKLEIPLTLRSLVITDKEIRIKTASRPEPFAGITYRYTK